jgi:hypothetical protein
MFYNNAKYVFALWAGSPEDCAGGIIAASAVTLEQLKARGFADYPYLQHRLFDPQLYLAGLDPSRAHSAVSHLASYPWFGTEQTEAFDKTRHRTVTAYEKEKTPLRVAQWTRSVPTNPDAIAHAARSAVQLQLDLECEGIILPSPLIDAVLPGFTQGTAWIDAGLTACADLRVNQPIYATIALCDSMIDGRPAADNTLIGAITEQVAARDGLAGAYVVVETRTGDAYSFQSADVVQALLIIADDLIRGAGQQMVVNYAGSFGAVLAGAGAHVWASGYYRSQRRLKSSDFDKQKGGGSRPRYYSLPLAGDIGVQTDIDAIVKAKLFRRVMTESPPAELLHTALRVGKKIIDVPSWEYKQKVTASGAHYNHCMVKLGAELEALDSQGRVEYVESWLTRAAEVADQLRNAMIIDTRATELDHQAMWLDAFRAWRKRSGR